MKLVGTTKRSESAPPPNGNTLVAGLGVLEGG
jgi:hypothetical protein